MEIGHFKKLDQKNRLHLPQKIMDILGIENDSEVYVSNVIGEDFIRVYPKNYIDKKIKESKIHE